MGNYRKKWWEENDLEEVPRRGYSVEENRSFRNGRKYERRRILRIVLWCIAGLIIFAEVVNLIQGCIIYVPVRR